MGAMQLAKQVALQRKLIEKELLPDTCQIYPKSGANPTIVGGVLTTTAATPRTWRGVTTIPCRVDLSRAFRPDKLPVQAVSVDEYNLELPFDTVVEPTDLIYITNRSTGKVEIFEVRKRKAISAFDGTVECTITVPGADFDAHS
jgi:hypothetical protein